MLMIFTPKFAGGSKQPLPATRYVSTCEASTPIMVGMEGPVMSASTTPTPCPMFFSANATLTEEVNLPTPPLALQSVMVCLTPGIATRENFVYYYGCEQQKAPPSPRAALHSPFVVVVAVYVTRQTSARKSVYKNALAHTLH
ncbi:hypothetical protein TraAM80_07295 [Trypanosoma rangeli]|uniref:Uncharacterized protein n=1 Tax=Trypanosoma rangeli TaxID=5698 RepID=A0A3R7M7R3_TRYRA|nr:uncharacterized protein TraAM80_07295 [Trypanosoma rangeli]RNF00990.1 hypothetical protein TraAM80_07295 [Trypanosoma rangeli]|eukprot:RNF00990.1 hypothetical protein TraAM80_07295 [Trypanosoma rangeli]